VEQLLNNSIAQLDILVEQREAGALAATSTAILSCLQVEVGASSVNAYIKQQYIRYISMIAIDGFHNHLIWLKFNPNYFMQH